MLHAHEQVGAYLHRCKQSVPAVAQRKGWNNGPPSLLRTQTQAHFFFHFRSSSLLLTHTHTRIYSITIKWTVWKHKAQQASLVSYIGWWFKAEHTTEGREAEEQEANRWPTTSSFLLLCFCFFFFFIYFSLSPQLAEDEWVMLYWRPGSIHAAIGDRQTHWRSAVSHITHKSPHLSFPALQDKLVTNGAGELRFYFFNLFF